MILDKLRLRLRKFAAMAALVLFSSGVDAEQTSFESSAAGKFQTLRSEVGLWTVSNGEAFVDDAHAKSGKRCLRLAGEYSVVQLEFDNVVDSDTELSFWAERWTSRGPFNFCVEKQSGGEWIEVYNGDGEIRVGRSFLTPVRIPLVGPNLKRVRIRVTSPAGSGVLIDDVRLAPLMPQNIIRAEVVPMTLPALIGAPASALLKLEIETSGSVDPIALTGVLAGLETTTNTSDFASLQVYYTGSSTVFSSDVFFGKSVLPTRKFSIDGSQVLAEGTNYFWIACTLDANADIDHHVGAYCMKLSFSNGSTLDLDSATSIQRIGVSVRTGGDDGVHTYRIPGLATTKAGTLIAVYDIRYRGGGDLPGDIDVGMSRSTDDGRTWAPMQVIMNMGDDPNFLFDGIGDPTVLVDNNTGTVWCAATWSHGNRSWHGSDPGLEPEETGQWILVNSEDDGITWSDPINITQQVKKPSWSILLQGPGKGITMRDGTIVFPAQYQDPPHPIDKQANRLPHSALIYSEDHGKTWATSTGAFDDTTEAQVVELDDGEIMINCRYNREATRVVMTTSDKGKTWTEHPTSRKALIEPGACMASLINVGRELRQLGENGKYSQRDDFLLFSNPDSLNGRNHITIKASLDGGQIWPPQHHLLLDEQNGAGYSCMAIIDPETVGIIYEGSQAHMTFQRVKITDILTPPSNQKTKNPAMCASP